MSAGSQFSDSEESDDDVLEPISGISAQNPTGEQLFGEARVAALLRVRHAADLASVVNFEDVLGARHMDARHTCFISATRFNQGVDLVRGGDIVLFHAFPPISGTVDVSVCARQKGWIEMVLGQTETTARRQLAHCAGFSFLVHLCHRNAHDVLARGRRAFACESAASDGRRSAQVGCTCQLCPTRPDSACAST
jgi:hypothetical protein